MSEVNACLLTSRTIVGQGLAKLIVNVENIHLFGDAHVINLMDNPFFGDEGSALDCRMSKSFICSKSLSVRDVFSFKTSSVRCLDESRI